MQYLLFPRTNMFAWRTALTFTAVVALTYLGSGSSPHHNAWWVIGVAGLISVFFEWGPYSARNQWTDLRRRERLPKAPTTASHRANLYTSAIVLGLRVVIPYAWITLLAPGLRKWALAVGGVLLGSVVIDAVCERVERQLGYRTAVTRLGEGIGRAMAFIARGLTAWRTAALLVGASIAPVAVWVTLCFFALFSTPWIILVQLRERAQASQLTQASERAKSRYARIEDSVLLRHIRTWKTTLERAPRRVTTLFGEVMFGRSFDAWRERKSGDA